jgi:hypothetical protein
MLPNVANDQHAYHRDGCVDSSADYHLPDCQFVHTVVRGRRLRQEAEIPQSGPNKTAGRSGVEPARATTNTFEGHDSQVHPRLQAQCSTQAVRFVTDGGAMDEVGEPRRDIAITTLLVGALTGQHQLSESDRQAVGNWMIDHAEETEVRDLLTKIVRTQIGETSEFREKVAEAIREKFRSEEGSPRHV